MSILSKHVALSLFTLLSLSSLSSAWVCFPAPDILPVASDCVAVINGIDWFSRLPGENVQKRWGRHLPVTPDTETLPRWYWIEGRQPPTTCAVVLDVDGMDFWEIDTFRLSAVARATTTVYSKCLVNKGQIGLDFPSEEGHVYAKLERLSGRPPLLGLPKGSGNGTAQGVVLPDNSVLYIADANLDSLFPFDFPGSIIIKPASSPHSPSPMHSYGIR